MQEPKSWDGTPIKIGSVRIACSNTILSCYHSVVIPYVEKDATEWHPKDDSGPFSVISRGAFASEQEAHRWAKTNLAGHPYHVKAYPV